VDRTGVRDLRLIRGTTALAVAALIGLIAASSASAATTMGQTFAPEGTNCNANNIWVQTMSPGVEYAAPFPGVITSWAFEANASVANIRLKLLRPGGGDNFTVVGESDVVLPIASQLNTYPTRIPVRAGDVIAVFNQTAVGCLAARPPGFSYSTHVGDVPPGMSAAFNPGAFSFQLDLSATLEPDADNDGFGDESQDCAPSNPSLNVDCAGPETTITKRPKDKTKKKQATFEFSSGEPGSPFECSLNGGPFEPCTSPDTVKGKKGKNHFEVRAKDALGNTGSPASDDWKVKKRKKKKK